MWTLFLAASAVAVTAHMVAVEVLHRVRIVDGPDSLCLGSSTKTGFMPPAMHFFTHAAPVPVCLAPHMESEIQPSDSG